MRVALVMALPTVLSRGLVAAVVVVLVLWVLPVHRRGGLAAFGLGAALALTALAHLVAIVALWLASGHPAVDVLDDLRWLPNLVMLPGDLAHAGLWLVLAWSVNDLVARHARQRAATPAS